MDTSGPRNSQWAMTRWSIKSLLEDDKLFQSAQEDWKKTNRDQSLLGLQCTKQELDQKVEWFEN